MMANTVLPILLPNSYNRDLIILYQGCAGNFIGYDVVVELLNQLMDGNQAVIDIMALLAEKQANFELQCGQAPGSLDGLRLGLVLVNDAFSGFIFAAEDARNLLECQPINELYKDFFHDGVCGRLPNTLNWMFATMILVLAFGMVIFTLRGAMVPSLTKEQPEDYYHSKESERGLTRELAQVELKHGTDNDAEESVAPPQAEPVEEMNDDAPTSKESAGWFGSSFRSGKATTDAETEAQAEPAEEMNDDALTSNMCVGWFGSTKATTDVESEVLAIENQAPKTDEVVAIENQVPKTDDKEDQKEIVTSNKSPQFDAADVEK